MIYKMGKENKIIDMGEDKDGKTNLKEKCVIKKNIGVEGRVNKKIRGEP